MGLSLKDKLIIGRGIQGDLVVSFKNSLSKDSLFSILNVKAYSKKEYGICKMLRYMHIRDRTILRKYRRGSSYWYMGWEGLFVRRKLFKKTVTYLGHEILCFRGVVKRIKYKFIEPVPDKQEGFLPFKEWVRSRNKAFYNGSGGYQFLEKGYGLGCRSYFNGFSLNDHKYNFSRFYNIIKHIKSHYGVSYDCYNGLVSSDEERENSYKLLWKSLERRKIEVLTCIEDRELLGQGQTLHNNLHMEFTSERILKLKRNNLLFGKFLINR